MQSLLPLLKNKSFFEKLVVLIFLILVSMLVTMVFGLVLAIPFYGLDLFRNFDTLSDISNPTSIGFLKYFQIVNQIGIFILPVFAYAYLETRTIGANLLLNTKIDFKILAISTALILLSIPIVNTLVIWNEQMTLPDFLWRIEDWMRRSEDQTQQLTRIFLETNTVGGLLVNLIMIALLAALGEELLFRGAFLKMIYQRVKNVHVAVWISAFVFSAFHLQFYGFVPRLALGLLFGYLFVWSGSLWIPIVLHFIFNGISVIAAFLYQHGIIDVNAEALGTTQNNLILILSGIASFVLFGLIYKFKNKRFENTGFTDNIVQ
jgi:membrane protease YdiL (CAAX protease family)